MEDLSPFILAGLIVCVLYLLSRPYEVDPDRDQDL